MTFSTRSVTLCEIRALREAPTLVTRLSTILGPAGLPPTPQDPLLFKFVQFLLSAQCLALERFFIYPARSCAYKYRCYQLCTSFFIK